MHPRFKHFLKKYLLYYKLKKRFSHAETARQQTLFEHFKVNKGTIDFKSVGFKLFSQFEEDGLLLYAISCIDQPVKTFLEFGSDTTLDFQFFNITGKLSPIASSISSIADKTCCFVNLFSE